MELKRSVSNLSSEIHQMHRNKKIPLQDFIIIVKFRPVAPPPQDAPDADSQEQDLTVGSYLLFKVLNHFFSEDYTLKD